MLWLDTGSSDSTVEAARTAGIVVHQASIRPFRFDDARNIAMSLIPPDIDIVIQLDADEVFVGDWITNFDNVKPGHKRWSYWLTNDTGNWGRVKRQNCHRREGFRWEHPIHEVVNGADCDAHLDDLFIEHRPDIGKSRSYALDMLQYWSNEYPDDARTLFYLGREYKFRAMWDKARVVLWKYLGHRNATWAPERQEAWMYLAQIDQTPERWLWKAVAEEPRRREPYVYLAKHHLGKGDNDMAWAMIMQAASCTDFGIYTTHAECWDAPFDKLYTRIERKQ